MNYTYNNSTFSNGSCLNTSCTYDVCVDVVYQNHWFVAQSILLGLAFIFGFVLTFLILCSLPAYIIRKCCSTTPAKKTAKAIKAITQEKIESKTYTIDQDGEEDDDTQQIEMDERDAQYLDSLEEANDDDKVVLNEQMSEVKQHTKQEKLKLEQKKIEEQRTLKMKAFLYDEKKKKEKQRANVKLTAPLKQRSVSPNDDEDSVFGHDIEQAYEKQQKQTENYDMNKMITRVPFNQDFEDEEYSAEQLDLESLKDVTTYDEEIKTKSVRPKRNMQPKPKE